MKNLNLSLWIFTTAMTSYFAYHTYTHTRIRYRDLESVMQQNLAVEKGIKTIKLQTENQYVKSSILVGNFGNNKRHMAQLEKAMSVRKQAENISVMISKLNAITKSTKIDEKWQINDRNTNLLSSLLINFPHFVAKQDTSLKKMGKSFSLFLDTQKHYVPFFQQYNLKLNYTILQLENRGVYVLVSQVGPGCVFHFDKIIAMASAKSQIVEIGKPYQATMFVSTTESNIIPQMSISEGSLNVKGYVGEIEIKNVKAQNYNSEGKATKILTGKITIKKADGSDTTFTLSTSYTVKKLVN